MLMRNIMIIRKSFLLWQISFLFFTSLGWSLPQINIDKFDKEEMEKILKEYGTFELVGSSIEKLNADAINALEKTREILMLPIENLERVKQVGFHGFQNVRQETLEKQKAKIALEEDISNFPIRNQIAFHFKPYKEALLAPSESRIPLGIDALQVNIDAYKKYYNDGMKVLHRLYKEIADNFIPKTNVSDLENDTQSVLTTRRYFKGTEGETGIPEHSDYGLLTLVVSDQPGLEVKHCENWLSAECTPKLRFYVNVGDWLLFQTGRKDFTAGIHRVPHIDEERFSMALFLNPPYTEEQETPKGGKVPFQKFLFSDKSPYK